MGLLGGLLAEVQLRAHDRVTVALRYARTDRSSSLRDDARARAERRRTWREASDGQRAAAARR